MFNLFSVCIYKHPGKRGRAIACVVRDTNLHRLAARDLCEVWRLKTGQNVNWKYGAFKFLMGLKWPLENRN